jgi:hypothetical protein
MNLRSTEAATGENGRDMVLYTVPIIGRTGELTLLLFSWKVFVELPLPKPDPGACARRKWQEGNGRKWGQTCNSAIIPSNSTIASLTPQVPYFLKNRGSVPNGASLRFFGTKKALLY